MLRITTLLFALILFISCKTDKSKSSDTSGEEQPIEDSTSTTVSSNPLKDVYWGDQHLHTAWSADAGAAGTRLGPEDAVRFAKGETVTSATGQKAKLNRPLDWLVVTDHSDALGTIMTVIEGGPEIEGDEVLEKWHADMAKGGEAAAAVMMEIISAQSTGNVPKMMTDPEFLQSKWEENTSIMDRLNEPGKFTAFIGYEWTSNYGGGNNLHRNVIYRNDANVANQVTPLTTFETENPEDLWKWMANYEEKTGGRMLAIPHNGNLSNGLMFNTKAFDGSPLTKELAALRNRYERLFEATQGKGTSEAHPSLSPDDEFADFELWDKGNLTMAPKRDEMIQYEYIREALKNGLALETELGVNPFEYGLASGTDSHTALTTAEEDNYWGKYASSEPSAERWFEKALDFPDGFMRGYKLGGSGYTGVWAESNTREALWDAMYRKETYSTTGPRITVRFFGGFDYTEEDAASGDMVQLGYDKGVPMGGKLSKATEGKSPTFMIAAKMDPESGNLDRIQVIKGWLDANGKTQEKIYNVAWANDENRNLDANGKLPEVGNTVDIENASWENNIGAPELSTYWTDPDFDPNVKAFYYVRVIEIPTPRWTTFDAKKFNLDRAAMEKENVPMTLQERAFTSPIWYDPVE